MLNKRADKLELLRIAEAVALEKSIDKELIIDSMETGIAKAAKSKFGQENEIKVLINRDNGDIGIFRKLVIVEKPENTNTEINLKDANARNIKDGDVVKLFNDRGACLAGAIVNEKIRPGVVQISTGAWYDPENPLELNSLCKHGNPNVLTPDKGTSKLGQGPIAHSCLIEIEKFTDKVPKVTAHEPPNIIRKK